MAPHQPFERAWFISREDLKLRKIDSKISLLRFCVSRRGVSSVNGAHGVRSPLSIRPSRCRQSWIGVIQHCLNILLQIAEVGPGPDSVIAPQLRILTSRSFRQPFSSQDEQERMTVLRCSPVSPCRAQGAAFDQGWNCAERFHRLAPQKLWREGPAVSTWVRSATLDGQRLKRSSLVRLHCLMCSAVLLTAGYDGGIRWNF
jgi:hypothetical protein